LDQPVEIYELVGAGALRSRLRVAAARGLTRLVGRERELEQLYGALGQAATGHGQVAAIVGEAGVGKSRLVWEVTHSHRVHGWLVLHAGSMSYGKPTSYLPVIDLLKGYLEVQDRDDPGKVRERVVGKLLTLDESLKAALPAFLGLLDAPIDDPHWQALDPAQRRQRTLDAIRLLFLRESQRQPLLVIFEDLHWIDGEPQALLDSCVESVPTARMLLLVNYRPEYGHRWGSKAYYTQLRLDALAPESAETLLDALLGDDTTLRPLKDLVVERTEGNPFFLEESVQTLVETRVLVGTPGAYRLTKPIDRTEVPATVHAVLAARIDRLPPAEKHLLQAASVVGKDVPYPILSAIVDEPEDALRRRIAHLQETEFLYETSLFPDLEYTFKHALTHEVAYGSLLQERRRALHGRIMEAIETLYADRLAEHVERLAHHALRGELWDEAPGYLRQAGRRALGRSAYRQAAGWLEQALEALGHVHESRATRELAIDLRLDLRNALWPAGDHAPILARLREAEALAEALGDQRRLVEVRQMLANSLRVGGESRLAIEVGERARAMAARLGDDSLSWRLSADMAAAHASLGEFRRAVELLGPVVDAVQDHPQGAQAVVGATFEPVYARLWLALALGSLGEFREACSEARKRSCSPVRISPPASLWPSWRSGWRGSTRAIWCRPSPRWSGLLRCAGSGTSWTGWAAPLLRSASPSCSRDGSARAGRSPTRG
jgi:predicted ATPase